MSSSTKCYLRWIQFESSGREYAVHVIMIQMQIENG